jgi:hypothetical protein
MSFTEFFPVINPQILNKLFVCLREEIKNYYSLIQKNFYEEIPYNKEIRKIDIESSKDKIDFLNKYINANIDKHMKILKLKEEIEKENEIKNKLEKKSKKIDDIINKGKKILIKDLPYFEKLSEYSNKKLKIAKLSSLDLINLTLRLSQQSKAPPGAFDYLNNMVAAGLIDDSQNNFNIFSYYIKNKNRYLYPYPNVLELKNSILRYDYSEENRLKPPILIYPNPDSFDSEGNIIANKGSLIKLKYPSENPIIGLFFKYSKDPNIAPSSFSGQEYKEFSLPDLDKDCIFKVCSCKKGYKDSKIITFKFVINNEKEEILAQKEAGVKAKLDQIGKERNRLDSVGLQFGSQLSSGFNDSPHNYVNQGTSSYHPAYFNPDDANDDDNDDEFSI